MSEIQLVYTVEYTDIFAKWLKKLKNYQAKANILNRITRIETDGFFGDVEPVGESVSELRIHTGAGYRVYFVKQGKSIIVLLCAGDKDTQQDDVIKAKQLAKELKNENSEI